ncbi:transporter substrate-binding domain-containing protein [Candidatus Binatia bacterium]|nr:transporter substrate-binding domain-containing protein [Candidatus Binatia bacterium]
MGWKGWPAAAMVGVLALGACATRHHEPAALSAPKSVAPVIARILHRGELVVGTTVDQPPLTMEAKNGNIIGLEPDLGQAMAEAMGVRLRVVTMQFGELVPAIEAGDIDVALGGVTMTPQRNLKVAFVGPYLLSGKTIVARSEDIERLKDRDRLNDADLRIVALQGSTSEAFVRSFLPTAQLILANSYDAAVRFLVERKADAMVADYPAALLAAMRYPWVNLEVLKDPLSFEPLGIALPPNDPLLVNWTTNFLDQLDGTGALEALQDKWFNSQDWLEEVK